MSATSCANLRGGCSSGLRLATALSVLAACAPSPNPSPAGPPPPTVSSAVLSVSPPPGLSVFAEGWEITVANTRGPVVIHDRLLGAMATVEGERIARMEAPFRWLPIGPGVTGTISGGWPEGALLTLRSDGAILQFFRRTKETWEKQQIVGHDYRVGYRITASDGSYLDALTASAFDRRSLVFVRGSSLMGRPLVSLGGDGTPTIMGDISLEHAHQIAALPNGEVAVLGVDVNEQRHHNAWFVERWRPGGTAHESVEVPDTVVDHDSPRHASVRMCPAPDDTVRVLRHAKGSSKYAFLTLRGATWDVDEKEIHEIPAEVEIRVAACAVGRDGSAWVVLRSVPDYQSRSDPDAVAALFRRTPGGALEHVPYPMLPPLGRWPHFVPTEKRSHHYRLEYRDIPPDKQTSGHFHGENVLVADDGSVWIDGVRWGDGAAVQNDDVEGFHLVRRAVLRVGPPLPATPITWETFAPGILEARLAAYNAEGGVSTYDWVRAKDVGPKCGKEYGVVFARLSDLSRTTPADESFPAVRAIVHGRKELTGSRFVEARIEDVHVLGAFVPSVKTGQHLLSLLKGRIPSAGARLYCGRPHVVRAIPMGIEDE